MGAVWAVEGGLFLMGNENLYPLQLSDQSYKTAG